jgi:hypothetical protein
MTMAKEHIAAGTEVRAGTYRCNACANELECEETGEKLPLCCVCDSASWRTYRLKEERANEQKA